MTRILGLVLLLSLAGAGAAWSKTVVHRPRHGIVHRVRIAAHPRHGHRQPGRRRLRATATNSTRPGDARAHDAARVQADASGPPAHPGWFKGDHEAGWGFSNGRATTVVGLYQRPLAPDIPADQVYHTDSRGAVGLSLSFKLGQ